MVCFSGNSILCFGCYVLNYCLYRSGYNPAVCCAVFLIGLPILLWITTFSEHSDFSIALSSGLSNLYIFIYSDSREVIRRFQLHQSSVPYLIFIYSLSIIIITTIS